MNDRFQDLRTYVAVVQGRGFATAADRLGLVKSAVSRRVRELEERLGTRLLNRTTRSISVTDAGGEFYWRAVRLLADLDEAEALASSGSQEPAGRLKASAPVALVERCLAEAAGELLQRHPRLVLELNAEDAVVDLVGGGYDVALRVGDLQDSTLVSRRLAMLGYVHVATPAYLSAHGSPASADELRAHRRIAHVNREAGREQGWHPGTGEARLVLDSEEAMLRAVLAGGGVAALPRLVVAEALAGGLLVDLSSALPCTARPLNALFPSSRNLPAKTRSFLEFIERRLAALPAG